MAAQKNFSERVVFDFESGEISDGSVRYMMIRPDGLMGLFRRLDDESRAKALIAFAESIYEHGGRSAQRYRDQQLGMGADEAEQLLDVIADTAPRLGWGRWTFDQSEAATLHLAVVNSPFATGFGDGDNGAPVCAPISGMFKAISEMLFGCSVSVCVQHCAVAASAHVSKDDADVCKFPAKAQR